MSRAVYAMFDPAGGLPEVLSLAIALCLHAIACAHPLILVSV